MLWIPRSPCPLVSRVPKDKLRLGTPFQSQRMWVEGKWESKTPIYYVNFGKRKVVLVPGVLTSHDSLCFHHLHVWSHRSLPLISLLTTVPCRSWPVPCVLLLVVDYRHSWCTSIIVSAVVARRAAACSSIISRPTAFGFPSLPLLPSWPVIHHLPPAVARHRIYSIPCIGSE